MKIQDRIVTEGVLLHLHHMESFYLNRITDYGPKLQPSSDAYNFNLGADVTKKGIFGKLSFSWGMIVTDLTIANLSVSMINNTAVTRFTYSHKASPGSYQKDQTEQQAAVIIFQIETFYLEFMSN